MRLSMRASVAACAGSLAIACTDPTAVTGRSAGRPTVDAAGASRVSYPNSVKYRDAGFHPATARAGSATISARALLGRSGTTDVEVTTGTFDDAAPAPGQLASVQLKAYDHGGALAFTSNHTALQAGGSASFAYTKLSRGTALQLQAVVRAIDAARSDVVTLTDNVHLRPDLVALRLDGPARAAVGQPVNFTGFVAERAGDLGARASCVLYVDGSPADRAEGIWVDAAGTIACAMSHRFTDAGTHALELRVESVQPGDYDDSNNNVSASIDIVAPREFLAYGLQAMSEDDDTWYRTVSPLTLLDGTTEWWDQTYRYEGRSQYASINGIIHGSLAFPIHINGEMSTNGATIDSFDRDEWGQYIDWMQADCAYDYAMNGGGSVYVCVYTGSYLAGYTTVQYDWWGADVRYHSDSWVTSWDPNGGTQRYIANDWTSQAPMVAFGPDFSARVSARGANDDSPTTAAATVQLSPFSYEVTFTSKPACGPIPATTGCFEDHFKASGVEGDMYSGDWPPYVP